MKDIPGLIFLLIAPYLVASLVNIKDVSSPTEEEDSLRSVPNKLFSSKQNPAASPLQTLTYDINVTISPWNKTNFSGERFTTAQFDSVFPPMSDISPPQNVSFHVLSHINPFTILNFTHFHLSLDFNLGIGILLPGQTETDPFTSFNLTGYADLELYSSAASNGYRLYIKDYELNDVIIPASETSKIDKEALIVAIDTIGQLYIEKANQYLAHKVT